MSVSRCILSWAQLKIVIFAMFVHKCIFRFTIGATVGHILPPTACICICSDWQHALNSVSLSLFPTKKSCAFVSWNLLKRRLSVQGHQRIIFSELEWICSLLIQKKKKPNALAGGNSFIYCLITTLFQNCTETFTESFILWLRCIMFLINYLLITDRLIRDKDQRCLIPFGNFQYAPRAAIFVDLFGSKLARAYAASATVYRLCR